MLVGASYTVAVVAALLVAVELAFDLIDIELQRVAAIGCAVCAATFFVFTIFDSKLRRSVAKVGEEFQRDQKNAVSPIRASDHRWGIWGTRLGGVSLGLMRLVLLVEFWVALLVHGIGSPIVMVATAGFCISMLLSLRYAASKSSAPDGSPHY